MIRTSLVVAFLGWSTVAAAQPNAGAPAPVEDVQPVPPPETTPPVASVVAPMQPEPPPPPPEAKGPKITVMWAPIMLAVGVAEFTAEYRVQRKLGVSVTLGAGRRTVEDSMGDASGMEIEGGAQVRYYAIGSFRHGMEVGLQALEEYVKFDEPLPAGVVGVKAGGFTVGGFLGYKIATRVGFTFEAQLGARYLVVEPAGQGAVGSIPAEEKWLPILHLNVGWSF